MHKKSRVIDELVDARQVSLNSSPPLTPDIYRMRSDDRRRATIARITGPALAFANQAAANVGTLSRGNQLSQSTRRKWHARIVMCVRRVKQFFKKITYVIARLI
jgi:hypothetical protein